MICCVELFQSISDSYLMITMNSIHDFLYYRRTHQIRLHLQYLNHPIGNDPNYGGIMFYGNPSDYDLCQKAKEKMKQMDHDSAIIRPTDAISTDVPATEAEIINSTILQHQRMENETLDKYIERTCVWCARCIGGDRTVLEFLVRSQGKRKE